MEYMSFGMHALWGSRPFMFQGGGARDGLAMLLCPLVALVPDPTPHSL